MCLIEPVPATKKWGVGYKSLAMDEEGNLTNYDCVATAFTVKYPLGKWIQDKRKKDIVDSIGGEPIPYPAGFHICLDKSNAESLWTGRCMGRQVVTVKCRYRKAHTEEGYPCQYTYGPVVVAKEIKVLEILL